MGRVNKLASDNPAHHLTNPQPIMELAHGLYVQILLNCKGYRINVLGNTSACAFNKIITIIILIENTAEKMLDISSKYHMIAVNSVPQGTLSVCRRIFIESCPVVRVVTRNNEDRTIF